MLTTYSFRLFPTLLLGAICLIVLSCMERTTLSLPDKPAEDATLYIGSEDRTFYAIDALTGTKKWATTTQEMVASSPAVSNGIVYALSTHQLYAMDAQTGQLKWTFTSEDTGDNGRSTITISDGNVYFLGNYNRKLYALDATTGAKKWAVSAPGYSPTNYPNAYGVPLVANGHVYVGGATNKLYMLDAQTGLTQQEFTVGEGIYGAPFLADKTLYVGCYDGKLYALNASTGQQQWASSLGGWLVYVNLIGQTLYINTWSEVFAVDAATGAQQWRFKPASSGNTGARSVTDGVVYGSYSLLDSPEATLYAVDATTGNKKWDNRAWPGGFNTMATRVIAMNGLLYAAGRDHQLYALDVTSGAVKWSFPTSSAITSSPCVVTRDGSYF